MEFPYSYFEDEVRDGYYVDALMKCCWAAQLEILNKIDEICRRHDIAYFAEWGTLLGTVRHGGFIPWDDDMDITMKRQDYNKFLRVAKEEMPEGWHLMNYCNQSDYWDVMTRVLNSKNICFEKEYLEQYHNFPFIAGVDIFPMDYLPTKEGEAEVLKELLYEVKATADSYGEGYLQGEILEEQLKRLELLCNRKISREGDLREHLYDIVVSLYALYHEDESEKIALMPLWEENGAQVYPKEYYQEMVRLPFDRTTIPVPVAYDSVLKQKYGDYMKMVRKGGSHDYPYYKKQMAIMEEQQTSFPSFSYDDRTKRKTGLEAERQDEFEKNWRENLSILENAHAGIAKLLFIQEYETAKQLLLKCQECAISLGNQIENEYVDVQDVIQLLEEYCELVFQIYELLQQEEEPNPEGVYQLLQEQLGKVTEELRKEHLKKRKIVFVVDKFSRWDSLEMIWQEAKEDVRNAVSVIVVPYYYKRLDGTILEEHYEKDLFENIEVLDYRQIDLEKYHPDVIYINTPYDEYNYFASIHPGFYSSKLVNDTDELIYIPWFTITELTREDERGWQSMQHFVTMPGVVNADRVYVQSEQMKNAYIEYLTDWAGEETKEEWIRKITVIDPKYIRVENLSEKAFQKLPDIWKKKVLKEDGSRKKIVLYTVSGTGFAEYGQQAVEKLKYVLQIFKENQENIVLLWYPDQAIEAALRSKHQELWREYESIVQSYRQEGWGIYAEGADERTVIDVCDAYYGDPCKLSQAVVVARKPVMLQNVTITD